MVDVAEQGIVSKAIVENEHHKIVHFTLAAGRSSASTRRACRL